jgi:hypothetical protein
MGVMIMLLLMMMTTTMMMVVVVETIMLTTMSDRNAAALERCRKRVSAPALQETQRKPSVAL